MIETKKYGDNAAAVESIIGYDCPICGYKSRIPV
jgi:hypothetical protein